MKFLSHSLEAARAARAYAYESTVTLQSQAAPGVTFTIVRLSFGRRMDLARRVLELARTAEFHEAGKTAQDSIAAHILGCEIDQLYLRWGLIDIAGLTVDGAPASPELLAEKGPESIAREIVNAIKPQCGLTENERKN